VWCEAVRSAILATAWLLIFYFFAVSDVPTAIMPLTGVINVLRLPFPIVLDLLGPKHIAI